MNEETRFWPVDDPEKIKPLMDKVLARKVAERRAAAPNAAWRKGATITLRYKIINGKLFRLMGLGGSLLAVLRGYRVPYEKEDAVTRAFAERIIETRGKIWRDLSAGVR